MVLVVALAVKGSRGFHTALRIDANAVVIANRVIDLQSQVLLGLVVQLEQSERALFRNSQSVEDVISTLDCKISV